MWCIVGTLPQKDMPLCPQGVRAQSSLQNGMLCLPDGHKVPVERGTAALAATALTVCGALGLEPPRLLLAGDPGSGAGSRAIYAWLEEHLAEMAPAGLVFHYLFPDTDGHNRVLLAARALPRPPLMVADAGFMYAAKMSGYADAYDLFTPDMGELAFLADEQAPHPFYTRGFLLAEEDDAPALLARAQAHGNCPANLLIKGAHDLIVCGGRVAHTVSRPCVPAMECIGGTGDMVTGLVTAFLVKGFPVERACLTAARLVRLLAKAHDPDPGTTVGQLLESLPQVLRNCGKDLACLEQAAAD